MLFVGSSTVSPSLRNPYGYEEGSGETESRRPRKIGEAQTTKVARAKKADRTSSHAKDRSVFCACGFELST